MRMISNTEINSLVKIKRNNVNQSEFSINYLCDSYLNKPIYQYNFENGLSIIMIPDKSVNENYFSWNVNCGSKDCAFSENGEVTKFRTGMAKFVEYEMLERKVSLKLKGNKKDIDARLEREKLAELKDCIETKTTKTYTSYSFKTKNKFLYLLPEFLKLMQEPLKFYDLKENERYLFRKVLLDEESEFRTLYNRVLKTMYDNKEIYLDMYGFSSDIKLLTENKMLEYYNKFYCPNNIVMIAIGDFEVDNLIKFVKKNIRVKNCQKSEIEKLLLSTYLRITSKDSMEFFLENLYDKYFAYGIKLEKIFRNISKEKILLEMIAEKYFGENSLFREKNKNILDKDDFGIIIECHNDFSHIILMGKSENRNKILTDIKNVIEKEMKKTLSETDFYEVKSKVLNKMYNEKFENTNEDILLNYFEVSNDLGKWLKEYDLNLNDYNFMKTALTKGRKYVIINKSLEGRK